ncbi:oxygen-insensitive NADPH nitroreductase [Virgibacillus kimchii]
MNQTIETMLNHRSVRKFSDEKLTSEQIEMILKSALQASTSSHVMAYTIIGVTDENLKSDLHAVSGHPHVKNNGHLFIFCADLQRNYAVTSHTNEEGVKQNVESTEQFIVATIDATLAAQNASIAAESMGLGICYLGSLRNDIKKVDELLELPEYVIPLFGLAVGHPEHQPEIKPRLPLEAIYHENTYDQDKEKQDKLITDFDEYLKNYYQTRSSNKKISTWTEQMENKYKVPTRMDVSPYVQSKKLNLR